MKQEKKNYLASNDFPELGSELRVETEELLREYLHIVKRVFESVRLEKPEILTELRQRANVRKRSPKKALR